MRSPEEHPLVPVFLIRAGELVGATVLSILAVLAFVMAAILTAVNALAHYVVSAVHPFHGHRDHAHAAHGPTH